MTKDKRKDIALAFIASLSAEHREQDADHSWSTCPTCLARDRILDDDSAKRLLRQYVQDERQRERKESSRVTLESAGE